MDERFYPKVEIILRCNFALSLSSLAWLELDGMTTKERGRGHGAAVHSVVRSPICMSCSTKSKTVVIVS